MMNIIEMLCLLAFNLFSVLVGIVLGQKLSKGREIKLNPVKAIKEEIKENKVAKEENLRKRKIDTMLQNIDSYDGTGLGQKQIPKD